MEMRGGGRGEFRVSSIVDVVEERIGFGENSSENFRSFLSRFRRLFYLETSSEHLTEKGHDRLTCDIEDGGAKIGSFREHSLEEFDELRRETGQVDVGEIVRAKFLPCGTVVREYNVCSSFEDNESETIATKARDLVSKDEAAGRMRANVPEDVGFFPVTSSEDLGSDVLSVSFSFQIFRSVPVALTPHSPLSSFRLPHRISISSAPTRTLNSCSPDNTQRIRSRPASCETEISNLEVTSFGDEDVRRFEIEVEDVARVHMRDSCREFGENLPDSRFVELFVFATIFFEPVSEIATGA
jgi:hypothetical protein